MNDNTTRARADLQAWESRKPDNFFTSDHNLQNVLRRYWGDQNYFAFLPTLESMGKASATRLDEYARIEDRIGNHPRLDRYNGVGVRTENIEFHPNHDRAGEIIWEHGVLALQAIAGQNLQQMALFYLLGHNGEAGHQCSIACTAGLIRALQTVGDETLKAQFLPALLRPNYATMQHGAQFLTEVQGGSDVGANALRATQGADGWRLSGEKWFCSNINAQQFLVMARPDGAPSGTRGLAVFLVPRTLSNGTTNGFFIRRLKDKLGTRTLASAELDFNEAVGYPIGALDDGFKNTVELVLNTSRLLNAVSCAGVMRRAYLESLTYAQHRQAFGQPIVEYPLVQEAIVDALSESYVATASGMALAHLLDQIETGKASESDKAVYRVLVNLNKYLTSIRGSEIVHRAIEVFGGNGAIESFSVLPRLYRDMVVLESWEGTHNVLCLQVLRDFKRYQLHEPFMQWVKALIESVTEGALQPQKALLENAYQEAEAVLVRVLSADERYQQAHARRLADVLTLLAQASLLLVESAWEIVHAPNSRKADVLTYFVKKHLVKGYSALEDEDYLALLARLSDGLA